MLNKSEGLGNESLKKYNNMFFENYYRYVRFDYNDWKKRVLLLWFSVKDIFTKFY